MKFGPRGSLSRADPLRAPPLPGGGGDLANMAAFCSLLAAAF